MIKLLMIYKLVIADVDGTLVAPSGKPAPFPSEKVKKAVGDVQKKGVKFCLATARSLPWIANLTTGLNLNSYLILDNGSKIYDCAEKKFIREIYIDKKNAEEVFSILKKEPDLRVFAVDDGVRLDDVSKITKWKLSKIMILGMSARKAERISNLLLKIKDIFVTISVSGTGDLSRSIHITHALGTKEKSLEFIIKLLKIKREETIGIGDSLNDLGMLKACGTKVAMGNSLPRIKQIADYIAPSYRKDGVADVLEKFILK